MRVATTPDLTRKHLSAHSPLHSAPVPARADAAHPPDFEYCLAVAAERTGVLVHAACVLSHHWHAVVSDPHGQLPAFTVFLLEGRQAGLTSPDAAAYAQSARFG